MRCDTTILYRVNALKEFWGVMASSARTQEDCRRCGAEVVKAEGIQRRTTDQIVGLVKQVVGFPAPLCDPRRHGPDGSDLPSEIGSDVGREIVADLITNSAHGPEDLQARNTTFVAVRFHVCETNRNTDIDA